MTIDEFVEMQMSYLQEFSESDAAKSIPVDTSYIDWNEHFEMWVDDNKVDERG